MKTSKKDFIRFKKEFLRWVEIFGLKDYEIRFYLNTTNGTYSQIQTDEVGKIARVRLCGDYRLDDKYHDIQEHAKHEAIHLLLSKLDYIAACRYCDDAEIAAANESIVRILEKVLK